MQANLDARDRLDALHNNYYVGPPCFGQRIRDEQLPKGFKIPGTLKTYDGLAKPNTWLDDFFNAIKFAGGTPNIAVQYSPARTCRNSQAMAPGPAGKIHQLLV